MGLRRQKNICSCKPLKANPTSLLYFNYPAVRSPPRTRAHVSSKTFQILKGQAQRLAAPWWQRSSTARAAHLAGRPGIASLPATLVQTYSNPATAPARLTAVLSHPEGVSLNFYGGREPILVRLGLPVQPVFCRVQPSSSQHLPAAAACGKALCGAMPVGASSHSHH